ncbi:conserved oligomeric Golgi complex component-related / COG complex component-related [Euphorbia peplus]|nr:conserved oligomeric Golgi complex component-related / COG complex component-related [Euphorbia peplus]
MEAAYETLQDVAGLTQLSSTVEDIFASDDLPQAAETLANMRHCFSTVGELSQNFLADIRSGKAFKEARVEQDDDSEHIKFSRDAVAQLLKFVELKVHKRILIVDELEKLVSKLELMVDFSEFSRFYDFVFFMCP